MSLTCLFQWIPHEPALREVAEESGYRHLQLITDLGEQIISFDHQSVRFVRKEFYILMGFAAQDYEPGEAQFEPLWLSWKAAPLELTFQSEREWIYRAKLAVDQISLDWKNQPVRWDS